MRMLERADVSYNSWEHELKDAFISGSDLARKFGQDPDRVFKTLVTQAPDKSCYVCVIPVDCELDLKKAASCFGVKKLDMLPMKELLSRTGYVHGGCSPVGMKKLFPTRIDETASLYDTIFVSGGRVGLQVEASPDGIAAVCEAEYADLTL